jgi:hypothetical protein
MYNLFNELENSLEFMAWNDWLIKWTGKNVEGYGRGLVWGTIPAFARKEYEDNTKISSQNTWLF